MYCEYIVSVPWLKFGCPVDVIGCVMDVICMCCESLMDLLWIY